MNADKLNRPSANPGGMECQTCGRIFIGDESHSECGLCHNTRPTAVASHAEGEVVSTTFEVELVREPTYGGIHIRKWQSNSELQPGSYTFYLHPPRSGDEARDAARFVYDTFAKDLKQGYRTRDKIFAVEILGQVLSLPTSIDADTAAQSDD